MRVIEKMQYDYNHGIGDFKDYKKKEVYIPTKDDALYFMELGLLANRILKKDKRERNKILFDLFKIPVAITIIITMGIVLFIQNCG